GACDFEAVRNIDHHLEGAKGGDHRGRGIARWAELAVPREDDGRPAWEPRAWHEIRARVAARAAARTPRPRVGGDPSAAPVAARLADGTAPLDSSSGEGNAEEWLDAVP